MIGAELSAAAAVMQARLRGDDGPFQGVSTDSRRVRRGELFFALRGPNFDGHDYARAALAAGARAAVVERELEAGPLLLALDTRRALGRLAAHWREHCAPRVVAVTGSNGKTTVKEMLYAVLAGSEGAGDTLATRGNLNNDIGVPLTLLALAPEHRYAVIEMGANHAGEIDYLSGLTRPDVALVTNANAAHLEGFGSIAGVARAKGEIFAGLAASGTAVINADDRHVSLWRELAGARRIITFGLGPRADVGARRDGATLTLSHAGEQAHTRLALPGEHNARNAAAACAALLALGLPLASIAAGLARVRAVAGRLQFRAGRDGASVIDDTYNANPASLDAALAVLAEQSQARKYLLLGDMGELGGEAEAMHRAAGRAARTCGVRGLYAVGPLAQVAARAFGAGAHGFADLAQAVSALQGHLDQDACVLVKGSRAMRMERAVAMLTEPGEGG